MTECIICRQDKANMSDEHVIPDALGGYYHIKCVCTDCNSHLGTKVDTHLINNKFGELYRSKYSIKGKKGSIPNPFGGTFINEINFEMKTTFRRKQDGSFEPYFMPYCNVSHDSQGNITGLIIGLDETDLDKKDEILKKIIKRNKLEGYEITEKESKRVENEDTYKTQWSMDFEKIKIGALKIAYEFAVDKIPNYYSDPVAKKISTILFNADTEAAKKYVKIGDGLNEDVIKPFAPILDTEENKHYLILTPFNKKLLCLIRINEVYVIGIILANRHYLTIQNSIIGVNDVKNRKFEVFNFEKALTDISGKLRLKFYSNGSEISSQEEDFEPFEYREYYGQRDIIPLYDKNNICIKSLHELLENDNPYTNIVSAMTTIGSTFKIPLPKHGTKYYIKSKNTKKLYLLDAIEMQQDWKRKL